MDAAMDVSGMTPLRRAAYTDAAVFEAERD